MQSKSINIIKWMEFFGGLATAGYALEALLKFIVSFFSSGTSLNLYRLPELKQLREQNLFYFILVMGVLILLPILKSMVWYRVTRILRAFNMEHPFKSKMIQGFERILSLLDWIIIASFVLYLLMVWLHKQYPSVPVFESDIEEYVFMTALIFIMIHVFKKGQHLQEDQNLTI